MERIANKSINDALALTKIYFESPAGKDYLEKRKEIEEIGMVSRSIGLGGNKK